MYVSAILYNNNKLYYKSRSRTNTKSKYTSRAISEGVFWAYANRKNPDKIQTSLRAPPLPPSPSLIMTFPVHDIQLFAMSLKADSEDPDQTARMRSLIWGFAARICSEGLFLQGLAPIQSWMLNYKIHQCWKLKLHTLRKLHFMPFLGEFTRLIKSNWTSPRSFQIQRHERRL